MENKNQLEILLKERIKEFGDYLIGITDNTETKQIIYDSLVDIPVYKLMLFIMLLDKNKIEAQIDDFIKIYKLNDITSLQKIKIKNYLDYFISVKSILDTK